MNPQVSALLNQLQNTTNDAAIWASIGNILHTQPDEHCALEEHERANLNIDILTATICYQQAIARDAQNPEYWWRLGSSLMLDETATIAHQSYDKQQCFMRAIFLDKKCAEAWCHLGATIKPDEYITIRIHASEFQYSRHACFVISISSALENPKIWMLLASCLKQNETLLIQGKSYNSRQCYCHVLEMNRLQPDLELSAWIALHRQMTENECYSIKGITFNKDDCAYKILTFDDSPISFDTLRPPPLTITGGSPEVIPSNNPTTSIKSKLRADAKAFQPLVMNSNPPNATLDLLTPVNVNDMTIPRLEILSSQPYIKFIGFHPAPTHLNSGQRECSTCKTILEMKERWDIHVLTKAHQDRVQEEVAAYYEGKKLELIRDLKAPQPNYCCAICHVMISGNQCYSSHLDGNQHTRREELMKVAECCNYVYCSVEELYHHTKERSSCAAFFVQKNAHTYNTTTPIQPVNYHLYMPFVTPVGVIPQARPAQLGFYGNGYPSLSSTSSFQPAHLSPVKAICNPPMVSGDHATLFSHDATNTNRIPPQATVDQSRPEPISVKQTASVESETPIPRLNLFKGEHITFIGFYSGPQHNQEGDKECQTCNKLLRNKEEWQDHVLTKTHLKKVQDTIQAYYAGELPDQLETFPGLNYVCELCHSIISGNNNCSIHIEGSRHKKRMTLMRVSTCCSYKFCSFDELAKHITSPNECNDFLGNREFGYQDIFTLYNQAKGPPSLAAPHHERAKLDPPKPSFLKSKQSPNNTIRDENNADDTNIPKTESPTRPPAAIYEGRLSTTK